MSKTQKLAVAAATTFAALAAATPGHASTARLEGKTILVTETSAGEANDLHASLRYGEDANLYLEFYDLAGDVAGPGCFDYLNRVRCDIAPADDIRFDLGGGDDIFHVSEVGTTQTLGDSVHLDLGPGNDLYDAETSGSLMSVAGGDGNDTLNGSIVAQTLDGGAGDDTLNGGDGADKLLGGPGDDLLTGNRTTPFADVLDGGEGRDRLKDYVSGGDPVKAPPISVTLDGQANDGRADEADNITGIEAVETQSPGTFVGTDADDEFIPPQVGGVSTMQGNGGNDVLTAGDSTGDRIDGGAGNDAIQGGFGDDSLVGGPGRDTVHGDRPARCNEYSCDQVVAGNDTIDVRDGEVDSVTCGVGTDKVIADTADVIAADCETVERPAVQPVARLTVVSKKLRAALTGGLTVRLTNVTGRVRLTARHGRKVVASGAGTASKTTGSATVKLRFTKQARRSLLRKRTVTLQISGAGKRARVTLKR